MTRTTYFWSAVSIIAAIAIGYALAAKKEGGEQQTVKTYVLPFERADELKNSLNRLFRVDGKEAMANASVFANGLLMVRAPEGMQKGIERVVEKVAKEQPQATKAVRIDCWLVVGEKGKASNLDSMNVLSTPLQSIDKIDGPRQYRVLEHLATNASSAHEVFLRGIEASVRAVSIVRDTTLGLQIDIDGHGGVTGKVGQIKSETETKSGDFLILGQNGYPGSESANLYYIVRAEILP